MKYHLARGEEQLGTFNDLDVSAGLREGRFKPTDLCWAEGMPEWLTLRAHLQELNSEEAAVPPPIPELPSITALRAEVRQDQVFRLELASLGQRFAAKVMDWLTILIPLVAMLMPVMDAAFEAEIRAHQNDPTALMELLQKRIEYMQSTGDPALLTMSWLSVVVLIVMIVNIVMLGVRGQSIGKLLTGIQIVRAQDGSRAGFLKAVLLRWFLFSIIEGIRTLGPVLMLGNIMLIFRKDRRCLHDLVADTLVTRRNR